MRISESASGGGGTSPLSSCLALRFRSYTFLFVHGNSHSTPPSSETPPYNPRVLEKECFVARPRDPIKTLVSAVRPNGPTAQEIFSPRVKVADSMIVATSLSLYRT